MEKLSKILVGLALTFLFTSSFARTESFNLSTDFDTGYHADVSIFSLLNEKELQHPNYSESAILDWASDWDARLDFNGYRFSLPSGFNPTFIHEESLAYPNLLSAGGKLELGPSSQVFAALNLKEGSPLLGLNNSDMLPAEETDLWVSILIETPVWQPNDFFQINLLNVRDSIEGVDAENQPRLFYVNNFTLEKPFNQNLWRFKDHTFSINNGASLLVIRICHQCDNKLEVYINPDTIALNSGSLTPNLPQMIS